MPKGKKKNRFLKKRKVVEGTHLINNYLDSVTQAGGRVESRSNKDLFFLDKAPKEPSKNKIQYWRAKTPYYEKILMQDRAIKANQLQQMRLKASRTKLSNFEKILISKIQKSLQKNELVVVPPTEKLKEKSQIKLVDKPVVQDIWSDPLPENDEDDYVRDVLSIGKLKRRPEASVPMTKINAIIVPRPGQSYNPSFEDHQDELGEAYVEETNIKARTEAFRRRLPSFKSSAHVPLLTEEDIQENNEDPENSEEDSTVEHVNEAYLDRKTQKERNKQLEKKKRQRILQAEAEKKALNKSINKIDEILKEVEQITHVERQKEILREQIKKEAQYKTAPMGKVYFKEDPKVKGVLLSEELPDRLRKLPGLVNPAEEMYKHLQRRNIIDAREHRGKQNKKKRTKTVERHYIKEDWVNPLKPAPKKQ